MNCLVGGSLEEFFGWLEVLLERRRRLMMKRCWIVLFFVVGSILFSSLGVAAAEFFERNGLALDGYDPVAYFTEQKPVKGSPEFHADYHGSTFHFVSAAHRDVFAADPSKYAPQYGGYCAYGIAKGNKAAIDPAAFTVVGNRLYLNYSETVRSQWLTDVPGYIRKADANWPEVMNATKVHE
jgi:YHS domain-containing protein